MILLCALAVAACSSDSGKTAPTVTQSTSATTAGSSAAAPSVAPTEPGTVAGTVPATAPTTAPSGSDRTECPSADDVGKAYGAEVQLDQSAASTGAVGLVFCPYVEVLAPGATGAFGTPATPDEFSITFTKQNIVEAAAGTPVSDLGQAATWSEGGDLSVWTGSQGVIVSITFTPPNGDARATAIAIAQATL